MAARAGEAGLDGGAAGEFLVGSARAFGGAIFFALPLLMTMEMWWLGFYMDPLRLALLMVVMLPVLIGLSHYSGFKDTRRLGDDVVDAVVAYGIGILASVAVLTLFNVIGPSMPPREILGKVALQAVPAGFGAVLANSQLAGDGVDAADERERTEHAGYAGEVFFMLGGALFLAFNVAPTEEMVLIAHKMTPWHALALVAVSLAAMHAFVYGVSFRGQHTPPEGVPWWSIFVRFTVVGYAVALLVSAYVLWTFGRYEEVDLAGSVMQAVVLGLPASLGAAAARLIL